MQPDLASSEYTVPFWPPVKSRPLTTVIPPHAELASGKPNAHFSLRRGTSAAVMPEAGWKTVLVRSGDHPFHCGPAEGLLNAGCAEQRPTVDPVTSPPSFLPVRYSASARRSTALKRDPGMRMMPFSASTTASGERSASASRFGARELALLSWHTAQSRL